MIAETSFHLLQWLQVHPELQQKLEENTRYFREGLTQLGFNLIPGHHPIIPVMLGDASLAAKMAEELLKHHIYVIGFSFPVVPHGQARIRTQMSAGLSQAQLERALDAFAIVGRQLNIIN
jgi:glycine C-acetyltransferase